MTRHHKEFISHLKLVSAQAARASIASCIYICMYISTCTYIYSEHDDRSHNIQERAWADIQSTNPGWLVSVLAPSLRGIFPQTSLLVSVIVHGRSPTLGGSCIWSFLGFFLLFKYALSYMVWSYDHMSICHANGAMVAAEAPPVACSIFHDGRLLSWIIRRVLSNCVVAYSLGLYNEYTNLYAWLWNALVTVTPCTCFLLWGSRRRVVVFGYLLWASRR